MYEVQGDCVILTFLTWETRKEDPGAYLML